jgi:hypothetical protein
MRPRAYSTFTPSKVDTDSCLIRIVNTCQDTSLRCSKPNIKANFHPLFPPSDPDPLNSWSRNYRLFWLRFEEAEVEPRGRKNLVVGMPWMSLWLPENLWSPVVCEMYIVVPTDAEVNLWVHKATVVASNVTLRSLTVQGIHALPEKIEFVSQNLSISNTLRIVGSSGKIGLYELKAGSMANVSVDMIDSSIDITSLAAPNLEVHSVNKAVCLVGPMNNLNTSSRLVGNLTRTIYSSTWECPSGTLVQCEKPWMHLISTGRGAVAFHALSVNANGSLSGIPQPASSFSQFHAYETQPDGTATTSKPAGFPSVLRVCCLRIHS